MKKYILDKETDKLIPWAEYIHEKKEVALNKDDKKGGEDFDTKSVELAQEVKKSDNTADKVGGEIESGRVEPGREIYPKLGESQSDAKVQSGVSDKVVITKEDTGPPGVRQVVKKKRVKRKSKAPDSVDGQLPQKHIKFDKAETSTKRRWLSL
mgnify:CR=1 FL=1